MPLSKATTGLSSIAPTELPHLAQNAREEAADERNKEGIPPSPVHSTSDERNSSHTAVWQPECFWHISQEQE